MKICIQIFIFMFMAVSLTSCNTAGNNTPLINPTPTSTLAPTRLATSDAGKSTVVGRIISNKTHNPLVNTFVRLAQVVRQGSEGAYVLDEAFSPGATSDENGNFVFANIYPSEYVIIVGDVNNVFEVIPSDDGTVKVWEVLPDKVVNVGDIYVNSLP